MAYRSRQPWDLENRILQISSVQGEIQRAILARIAAGIPSAKILNLEGDKIDANTITVRQLVAGSFDNLVSNPGFEQDVIDGPLDPHVYTASGGTFSSASGGAVRSGGRAARYDVDSQSATANISLNGIASDPDYHHSCTWDEQFYVEAFARWIDNATTVQPTLRIEFRDENGASLQDTGTTWPALTQVHQKVTHTATAPVGAAYVVFYITIPNGNASNVALAFEDIYARRMVGSSIIESLWSHEFNIDSNGAIRSDNFVSGTTGFEILGTGVAEFNTVTVRGTIFATAGEIGNLDIVNKLELKQGATIEGDTSVVRRLELAAHATTAATTLNFRTNTTIDGFLHYGDGKAFFASLGLTLYSDAAGVPVQIGGLGDVEIQSDTTRTVTIRQGRLLAKDGSAAAPSIAFINNSGYGFYRSGTNVHLALAGAEAVRINTTRFTMAIGGIQRVTLPNKATAGDPASPTSGDFYVNTNSRQLRLYANGAWRTIATW